MQAKLCPRKQSTFFCRRLKLVRSVLFGPFTSFSGSAGMEIGSCPTKYSYVLQTVLLRTTKYRTIQLYWTVTRTTRNTAHRQRLPVDQRDLGGEQFRYQMAGLGDRGPDWHRHVYRSCIATLKSFQSIFSLKSFAFF